MFEERIFRKLIGFLERNGAAQNLLAGSIVRVGRMLRKNQPPERIKAIEEVLGVQELREENAALKERLAQLTKRVRNLEIKGARYK